MARRERTEVSRVAQGPNLTVLASEIVEEIIDGALVNLVRLVILRSTLIRNGARRSTRYQPSTASLSCQFGCVADLHYSYLQSTELPA